MKIRRLATFILSGLGLVLFTNASKAVTTDEDMCRNGLFPSLLKESRLAIVTGEAESRLYFFDDMDGCPSRGAACQSKSYVVPGDELIVGKQRGDWSCVWYAGKSRETVGWVNNRRLQYVEASENPDWHGKWKQYAYAGFISIAQKAGRHYVLGKTKWFGAQLPDGTQVVHLGDLGGELSVEKNFAHSGPVAGETDAQYSCMVDYVRLGRFLIVHDNKQCGGVNVSFDGVYTAARNEQ